MMSLATSSLHSMAHTVAKTTSAVKNRVQETTSSLSQKITTVIAQTKSLAKTGLIEGKALLKKVKKSTVSTQETVDLALKNAKTQEAYLQILAQQAVYVDYTNGHKLAQSKHFQHSEYQVKKTIRYPEGIKALVIVQEQGTAPALLVLRGTDVWNIHNIVDNLNPDIGGLNVKKYKEEFKRNLEKLSKLYGRLHVIGHSYGGTVAQRLTSYFPEYICRCDSHNAPGVGEKAIKKFEKKVKKLPKELTVPLVASYRHAKDVVSLLGGKHLPQNPGMSYTMGSVTDQISHIDAHSFNSLANNAKIEKDIKADSSVSKASSFIEACRKELRVVVPLYKALNKDKISKKPSK